MVQRKYSPDLFKMGILTPCVKKDKDGLLTDNHSGIVATPLFSKLLEHIVAAKENPMGTQKQKSPPVWIMGGLSPIMAALLVTEVTAKHKDQGLPTYMAALDTQKLFNTIWYDSLFRKLFLEGHLDTVSEFTVHTTLLQCNTIQVKVAGLLSRTIEPHKGVGQGKVLPTRNYKTHLNLCTIRFGAHTGIHYCGTPTCVMAWPVSTTISETYRSRSR